MTAGLTLALDAAATLGTIAVLRDGVCVAEQAYCADRQQVNRARAGTDEPDLSRQPVVSRF